MAFFEWGVAFHDMDLEAVRKGEKSAAEVRHDLKGIAGKARTQIVKDYVAWPLVSAALTGAVAWLAGPRLEERRGGRTDKVRRRAGRACAARGASPRSGREAHALRAAAATYRSTAWANFVANIVRNVWAHSIIFCGHFPDQTYTFGEDEVADESRGGWYVRQLLGAANIEGGPLFHVISGNLGYQVEHHLYPDMPSTRYGEIAPRVRDICERYELPYNSGPLSTQLGMVHRTILRLAFPGGRPRPKPGPYRGGIEDSASTAAIESS